MAEKQHSRRQDVAHCLIAFPEIGTLDSMDYDVNIIVAVSR